MPISIARVAARTVRADLELESEAIFGDEKPHVQLEYRPGVLTPAFEAELREHGDNADGFALLVSKLVAAWDIEMEPGVPAPLDYESLRLMPAPLLGAVVLAVREHIRPNPTTGENSVDGSRRMDSSDPSPNTSHSFERRAMPASPPGN